MAGRNLMTTQMFGHRIKTLGCYFIPNADNRNAIGALK
jgi:hypothetical protein